MNDLIFNGIKSNEILDDRNFTVAKFVNKVDTIDQQEFLLPIPKKEIILDQSIYQSCVGHAYAMCKSILEYIGTNKWIDFSPYAIYANRAKGDYVGEGMYLQEAIKSLYKEGAYLRRDFNAEGEMPMIKHIFDEWRLKHTDLVTKAKDYTISGYGFANSTNEIKQYLKKNMPVAASFPVYDCLYDAKNGVVETKLKGTKYGYHCMTIIGWRKDNRWIVVNSWGTSKGMKGLYYIPFNYPIDIAIAMSDTIFPAKTKAKEIKLILNNKDYYIDGEKKQMDVAPFEEAGRTFMPVRFISESLGAKVEWDEATKKVTITSEEAIIEMYIGNAIIHVNGKKVISDVAPIERNDRTFLPIRIIAENLNCSVKWDENLQQITITSL